MNDAGRKADIATSFKYDYSDPFPDGFDDVLDLPVIMALPTRGNDIFVGCMLFIIKQLQRFKNSTLNVYESTVGPGQARLFAKWAREDADDSLLFLDADVGPHPSTLGLLLRTPGDVVVAPTYMYIPSNNYIHLNVHRTELLEPVVQPKEGGIEQIHSSSFCATLLRRTVIDAFKAAGENPFTWSSLIDTRWRGFPNDVIFFKKAAKLGLKVVVNWDIPPATHHKFVHLNFSTLDSYYMDCLVSQGHKEITEDVDDSRPKKDGRD